jgi:SAM-dependent methyltransferase
MEMLCMKDDKPSTKWSPFDKDVETGDAYQYTKPEVLSARLANERFTQMLLGSVDLRGKRVIDVGAGDGTYTVELARRGAPATIVGLDPAPKAIARAQSLYSEVSNLRFICGCTETPNEDLGRFDVAIYRGCLHHVSDPVAEMSRALQLADIVVFLEPNGLNPVVKALEKFSKYHIEHQEQSFSPYLLRRWVAGHGGKVTSIRFFGLVPMFSPDWLAHFGRVLEPVVELIPCLRTLVCGQYLLVAKGNA